MYAAIVLITDTAIVKIHLNDSQDLYVHKRPAAVDDRAVTCLIT